MYRCVSELKGLIIDVDTFRENTVDDWKDINEKYKCLFLITDEEKAGEFQSLYGKNAVYELAGFVKLFAPNQATHERALELMELEATKIAYVSRNRMFLDNAMSFLGGTIWVTDKVSYDDAGKAPDLICRGFGAFKRLILEDVKGFLGEISTFPSTETRGMIIPLMFDVEGEEYPMYMMGRYFGYSHYMSQLHPYSTALYLNKNEKGKAYGKYNDTFANLYSCAVRRIQSSETVNGIVSVPTRPGKLERFETILDIVCSERNVENLSNNFKCISNYPTQKSLSSSERQENIAGVFRYEGNLHGKHIVLIDDIVTTGATIRECVSVLKRSGAAQISIVVLAINQIQGYYWSSDVAQVSCNSCGDKMHLLINSKTKNFFYSCYECHSTKSFETGRMELYEQVNREMEW